MVPPSGRGRNDQAGLLVQKVNILLHCLLSSAWGVLVHYILRCVRDFKVCCWPEASP